MLKNIIHNIRNARNLYSFDELTKRNQEQAFDANGCINIHTKHFMRASEASFREDMERYGYTVSSVHCDIKYKYGRYAPYPFPMPFLSVDGEFNKAFLFKCITNFSDPEAVSLLRGCQPYPVCSSAEAMREVKAMFSRFQQDFKRAFSKCYNDKDAVRAKLRSAGRAFRYDGSWNNKTWEQAAFDLETEEV